MMRSLGMSAALVAAFVMTTGLASAQGGAEPTGPAPAPMAPAPGAAPGAAPAAAPASSGAAVGGQLSWNPQADTGQKKGEEKKEKKPKKLAWRGTTLSLDQSVNTQEIGVGSSYLSRDPTYELWYSFKPRYYVYDQGDDSVNVNARFDVYQELTNSDSTTYKNEPLFGDIWLNAAWSHKLYVDKKSGYSTTMSLGPRLIFGTSKASRGRGAIMQVGAGGGLNQTVPLAGPDADVFPMIAFTGSAYYTKAIDRCTTACNSSFGYTRQDTGGRTLLSDQLSGGAMVSHQVTAVIAADTSITQKLKLGLSYIWVLQWTYDVGSQPANVATQSGSTAPSNIDSPTNHRVLPWVAAELDYDLFDELSLSLGYYNATNQIGPDGNRRNPILEPRRAHVLHRHGQPRSAVPARRRREGRQRRGQGQDDARADLRPGQQRREHALLIDRSVRFDRAWSAWSNSAMALLRALCGVVAFGLLAVPAARAQSGTAPSGSAAPSPAPSGSAAPSGAAAPSTSAAPKPAGVTGGYAWTDKPRARPARRARRRKFDASAPIATFPGFRMLPDGRSQVFVSISKSVDVQVRRSAGRVVYVLGGSVVAIRNNTNALVTTWFKTPLARARLSRARGGAELVLELRQAVEPTFRIATLPGGWITLEVTLPAPTPAAATAQP